MTTGTHHDIQSPGPQRNYDLVQLHQFYFWQELKQDCVNHVCKCKDCQQVSLEIQHYVDSNLRIPNVPMACITMDLL